MQFVKFPQTGVVARVVGSVYSVLITYDRAEIHDRDEEGLKDDISLAISGTYGVINQKLSISGASNDQASPTVLIQVDFCLNGKSLTADGLPLLVTTDEAVEYFAKEFGWDTAELVHAHKAKDVRRNDETCVSALNGRELLTGSTCDGVPYVRVAQFGFELYYSTWLSLASDIANLGALTAALGAQVSKQPSAQAEH